MSNPAAAGGDLREAAVQPSSADQPERVCRELPLVMKTTRFPSGDQAGAT
jgi:hypothetical protein